ncbi:MAG: tetratricopeptide repeat protein, partial [Gammaproteobacteria bacterium]
DKFSHWQQLRFRLGSVLTVVIVVLVTLSGIYLWHANERYLKAEAVATTKAPSATLAPTMTTSIPAKSIAVLPFENLSADKNNAYFAAGMQDQIITRLVNLNGLKVIARTSTEKYLNQPEDLKRVGAELGVATVLEGSVQKAGNQVRINLQLINTATDAHIWAQTYDRDLANVLTVESEVATQVADALKVKLLPAEEARLQKLPTDNPQAYDALLRGNAAMARAHVSWSAQDYEPAEAAYREAIARDPQFALAWAQLARLQEWLASMEFGSVDPKARFEQSRVSAERALALDPALVVAHVAMGYYLYWGRHDFDAALREFDTALASNPRDAEALTAVGDIRNSQGQFEAAIAMYNRALGVDPRNIQTMLNLAWPLAELRRYNQADRILQRALSVNPNAGLVWGERDVLSYPATGDAQRELTIIEAAPANVQANPFHHDDHAIALYHARDFDDARRELAMAKNSVLRLCFRADIDWAAGQRHKAQQEYKRCAAIVQQQLVRNPDNAYLHGSLGFFYARLGQAQDALREGQRALELGPESKDWFTGGNALLWMAHIHAELGQADAAIAILDHLLSTPHGILVSAAQLAHDPDWDVLRDNSRFQALLKKYANNNQIPETSGGG